MAAFLVFVGFFVYAVLVASFGHYWRRHGFQWIEYVAGALIVVGGTWWALQLAPGADWFSAIVRHYGIAGVVVIPLEIGLAVRTKRAAEAVRTEDES